MMVFRSETQNGQVNPLIFDAEALGLTMRELAIDITQGEQTEFLSRWFHSPRNEADLFIWLDGQKRIIKQQLCFFGQVVEWNPFVGTRTGVIIEQEILSPVAPDTRTSSHSSHHSDDSIAEIIHFDRKVQTAAVEQAIMILSAVPELAQEDRLVLIHNLRQSPKLHKKARERAMQAWAPKSEEVCSDLRPTFWKRLTNWVLGS